MNKQEKIDLEEKITEFRKNFIKDFHLESLDQKEKFLLLDTASNALEIEVEYGKGWDPNFKTASLIGATYIQNFHLLKTNIENNEKLDNLNEKITNINEQMIQMNTKFDTLIDLLSKK